MQQLIFRFFYFFFYDFLLFFFLIFYDKKLKKRDGEVTAWYLILYSAGRFILEFWRGDLIRGSVGTLSTSQFIGIFTLIAGIVLLVLRRKSKPADDGRQTDAGTPQEEAEAIDEIDSPAEEAQADVAAEGEKDKKKTDAESEE